MKERNNEKQKRKKIYLGEEKKLTEWMINRVRKRRKNKSLERKKEWKRSWQNVCKKKKYWRKKEQKIEGIDLKMWRREKKERSNVKR